MGTAARQTTSGGRPSGRAKPAPKKPEIAPISRGVRVALRAGPPRVTLPVAPVAAPRPSLTGATAAVAPVLHAQSPTAVPVPGGAPPTLHAPAPSAATLTTPGHPVPVASPQPIGAKLAPGEVDLSTGELQIAPPVAEVIREGEELEVHVRLPGLAAGTLRLRKRGGAFHTVGPAQAILLVHPALTRLASTLPTVLALEVRENQLAGWVGLGAPGPVRGTKRSLVDAMVRGADLLGWAGLSQLHFPSFRNQFDHGVIDVAIDKLTFRVGGFLSGSGSVALDNQALMFAGSAKVDLPGGAAGELKFQPDAKGELAGQLDLLVQIGKIAGTVTASLTRGFVSVMGQVAYASDRLSGKVTLVATDEATARDVTLLRPSGGEVPIELPSPQRPAKPGRRAFCGWGTLTFHVNEWLDGTATVLVNSQGQATVIGEIAPPKELILFPQKEWVKRIFSAEIKAGYGLPVVGQVGVYAGVKLDAVAKLGPAKLYAIKLSGAYSTDPRVPKNLTIEGSLNISAFAGLRARAEAGLFVTILDHDIKVGAGLDAYAGVRGYVEATPRIGVREPAPGKREYFLQGHLELAAQPVLGFSGDLFVKLETPWWSPLSDHTWKWPLGSIEYPLPGEFGIGADVDYVLGSGKLPRIAFGEVNFDASKFMTDIMNDNTDEGRGEEEEAQGTWEEGLGARGPGGAKNKGGSGKTKQLETGIEPIGEEETFSDGGENHKLWFEATDTDAKLMMASGEPQTVEEKLRAWRPLVGLLLEGDQKHARDLLERADAQLAAIDEDADRLAAMNTATRKAKEIYQKYKGKKGHKGTKKGKAASRALSKKIRTQQRQLRKLLAELASLVRIVPFGRIDLEPRMYGGTESVSVVDEKTHAGLRIAKRRGTSQLDLLTKPTAPLERYSTGRAGAQRVEADRAKISVQEKQIGTVLTRGGQVNANNHAWLKRPAKQVADVVSQLGRTMRLSRLHRAQQFLPVRLGNKDVIVFRASPAQLGKGLYRHQFIKSLRQQLRDQQKGLRELSAEQWLSQRAKFSMDAKAFRALDAAGRKEVLEELERRAQAAKRRAELYVERLDQWIEATARKVKKSDRDYQRLQEWMERLDRAEQRKQNALDVLRELERVGKGSLEIPDLLLLKGQYEGTLERMRQRIVGRQGEERRERERHRAHLTAFLKYQKEWSELAKTSSDLAILHRPDQVAGGYDRFGPLPVPPGEADLTDPRWQAYYANLRSLFGPSVVNELIGKQWKGQIEKVVTPLKQAIGAPLAYPLHRMNLTLKIVSSGE